MLSHLARVSSTFIYCTTSTGEPQHALALCATLVSCTVRDMLWLRAVRCEDLLERQLKDCEDLQELRREAEARSAAVLAEGRATASLLQGRAGRNGRAGLGWQDAPCTRKVHVCPRG